MQHLSQRPNHAVVVEDFISTDLKERIALSKDDVVDVGSSLFIYFFWSGFILCINAGDLVAITKRRCWAKVNV